MTLRPAPSSSADGGRVMIGHKIELDMERLAQRMAHLDAAAFNQFKDYFGWRFRALFIKNGMNRGDAEELAADCVADIALKVETKYPGSKDGGFEAWVMKCACNACASWKRRRRVETVPLNEDIVPRGSAADGALPAHFPVPGVEPASENHTPNWEHVAAIREAIARLSEDDRKIVQLSYIEKIGTATDIAARLNIQPDAARQRLHRAISRLEAILKKDPRLRDVTGCDPSPEKGTK
jgi:RNA polymerase sigma factor (sigma-70 family)